MNIYIDFDDCLCETGRAFGILAADLFGKNVPYEEIRCFNLQQAFDLTDEQYDELLQSVSLHIWVVDHVETEVEQLLVLAGVRLEHGANV